MIKNWLTFAIFTAFLCSFSSVAFAEEKFKTGEIVIYKPYGKPEEGKVIRQDSSGVLILSKDWQDGTFKDGGSSCYYSTDAVSHKEAPKPDPVAEPGGGGDRDEARGGGNEGGGGGETVRNNVAPADLGVGGAPLSKQEIVDYLQARVGTDGPHPKKEAVNQDLMAQVRKRGVNFKSTYQDSSLFSKAGGNQALGYVIEANFGTPPTMSWLCDEWDLVLTSNSMEQAHNLGFLGIEKDNKYLWKVHANDSPENWINGTWRQATPAEMNYYGGAGIILLGGEQGWDWIVHKDDHNQLKGQDWINVADLSSRQTRRGGKRSQ